jgi:hypothetical protein
VKETKLETGRKWLTVTFAFSGIERIRTATNKRKISTTKLLFVFLSFPGCGWRSMIIHSPTHTYGRLCGVWKRVIGTDVNPARRRLVTTEVRAHRFINQFAHRSSLLAKILKSPWPI